MSDTLTTAEITERVIGEAIWAPSVHNTQPWSFGIGTDRLSLHADPGRRLAMADPGGREMLMSCGAALFTVPLALRSLGYVPVTRVLPDPDDPLLVAQVTWTGRAGPAPYEQRLSGQVRTPNTPPGSTANAPGNWPGGRHRPAASATTGVPATSYPAREEHTDPYFPGRDFAHGRGWGLPPLSTAPALRSAGVAGLLTTWQDRPAEVIAKCSRRLHPAEQAGGTRGKPPFVMRKESRRCDSSKYGKP